MYTRKKYGWFTGYDEESCEDFLVIPPSLDQSGWSQVLPVIDTLMTESRRKIVSNPIEANPIEANPIDTNPIDTNPIDTLQFIIPIAPSAKSKKYSSHKYSNRKRLSLIEDDLSWSLKK
jgi:hypothetical protein